MNEDEDGDDVYPAGEPSRSCISYSCSNVYGIAKAEEDGELSLVEKKKMMIMLNSQSSL